MSKTEPWHYCKQYNIATLGHQITFISYMYPDSKVHGAIMGPIWGQHDPGGPHVGPMNFAIWVITQAEKYRILLIVCTEHSRHTGACCVKVQMDGSSEMAAMGEYNFIKKIWIIILISALVPMKRLLQFPTMVGLQEKNMHQCIWGKSND